MLNAYADLIKDTISLLREEKKNYLLMDSTLLHFFPLTAQVQRPIEIPPPVEEKKVPLPQPTPVKMEEKKESPPPKKEPEPPPAEKLESPITLQDPPAVKFDNFSDLKQLMSKIAPDFPLQSKIPSDAEAKSIAYAYIYKNKAADISILSFHVQGKEKTLLDNIAKALDTTFFPTRLLQTDTIEKNNEWEAFLTAPNLKLIIACDFSIWEQKNLMKHYKEFPSRSETFIGNVPLFTLPNLALYLKDPLLKRSLWKALCQKIRSLPS